MSEKSLKILIAIEWKILLIITTVNNDNNSVGKSQLSLTAGTWGIYFWPRSIWKIHLCSENVGHLENTYNNFEEDSKVENQKPCGYQFEKDNGIGDLKYIKYKTTKQTVFRV